MKNILYVNIILSYSGLFLSNERTAFAHVTHLIKVISPLACNMKFISIFYEIYQARPTHIGSGY